MPEKELPFLEQLNQRVPLKEGLEGHRAILRAIYRRGHISLHDLCLSTLIPLPPIAKVVNFLIEKEVLGRIPEGILYTEKGMQFIEAELQFYGFGIKKCDECDGLPIYISPRWEEVLDLLDDIFMTRPTVDTTLDQAFATPETSLLRALYLYESGALEGKRVCFLGDDDYSSVATALLYKGIFPEEPRIIAKQITVVDIDDRLLNGINKALNHYGIIIQTVKWDYRLRVPLDIIRPYDTIVIDPPYSLNGIILCVSRAIALLGSRPGSEIYLSYAHKSPNEFHALQKVAIEMGCAIMEIIPKFNFYEGAQILGGSTQMIRLVLTGQAKPKIDPNSDFKDILYTGEISPTTRFYYCTQCFKSVAIGHGQEIETIEILKEKGCQYCHGPGPFELEDKVSDSLSEPEHEIEPEE